ncbi:4-(cytidine 5'-diphospho)-2-C-methyl-D-erythritol kinase [Undibacterium luofuense]|uniref:4-diphosphocytidyl-2-C-methyl-D-erythritol kinase n=1 Tax=Undibacterium luofuense TaxID=2828733 RepID=A0A941I5V4_9BURK|nr:4-(cytidine 5'-diphospho)-2-C-methyl-D-erythritol kinase [Undibacterium luofuense]MBR7780925.1 4-(cytidine 5'-diphospho)-2-C-methyl-D-erythritol kinase [Undibacterium luofuense]
MTLSLTRCPAPAKLNLFLHVNGRRSDGYHLLQTVFQLIDHSDYLDAEVTDDGCITRTNDVPGVPEDSDLIVRAARLLQQHTNSQLGARLTLHKTLPMGGGLGGGSSDAATTLMALNALWQTGLSQQELMRISVQLGADVPFFLFGENAFAEGIGEELQPVQTPDCWYVVIEPGVHVPTPAIFSSDLLTRDTKPVKITDFPADEFVKWKNDLQSVACLLYPEVDKAVKWLNQFGAAKMTGSGACVFCAVSDESEADKIITQHEGNWKLWKAKSLNIHPMMKKLQTKD